MAFSVPAIRTSGLTKYYDTIPGIIDLNLNVERGEKTTLSNVKSAGDSVLLPGEIEHRKEADNLANGLHSEQFSSKICTKIVI